MSNPIGWCDETWVPFAGCSKVSAGCKNCYAIIMANRLAHMPATKAIYGPTVKKETNGELNWTGKITENYSQMDKPLRTKKPTVFFLSSMSDIFHENITNEQIDDIFDIIARCPQHTFKVLTKRAERMHEWFMWKFERTEKWVGVWPLQNVHLGVSAENQEQIDKRVGWLIGSPAEVRFISCEPLLGSIRFNDRKGIDQVIVGGESGHNARPMHPDWVWEIKDQCDRDGVAFWFKQWGEYAFMPLPEHGVKSILMSDKGHIHESGAPLSGSWKRLKKSGTKANGCELGGKIYHEHPRERNAR